MQYLEPGDPPPIGPVREGVERPFWSVMIPTYNASDMLEKALRSVLDQDPGIERMQIAVVDDCSPNGEAERIEHAISEDIAQRLARLLGHPAHDPHGHPIPYSLGAARHASARRLTSVPAGERVEIASFDDRDARAVRKLAEAGVLPGLSAAVVANDDRGVSLRWERGEVVLPAHEAATVRVSPLPKERRG